MSSSLVLRWCHYHRRGDCILREIDEVVSTQGTNKSSGTLYPSGFPNKLTTITPTSLLIVYRRATKSWRRLLYPHFLHDMGRIFGWFLPRRHHLTILVAMQRKRAHCPPKLNMTKASRLYQGQQIVCRPQGHRTRCRVENLHANASSLLTEFPFAHL